jgi:hypothetical protein
MVIESAGAGSVVMASKFEVTVLESNIIFETDPIDLNSDIFYEVGQTYSIDTVNRYHLGNGGSDLNQTAVQDAELVLPFSNCFTWGNGFESVKVRDAFQNTYIDIDTRPLSYIEDYGKNVRYADMTYSEPYVENNGVNGLSTFSLPLANYKDDIEKGFGSIQKLYSRDTDIVVFQENKVSKVLFGKDLLASPDGSGNIQSVPTILNQQIAYVGEYGISKEPESFAFNGNNLYFTDSFNGAVMRLGANGLEEISSDGLRVWFNDKFKASKSLYKMGVFDPYHDQYVLAFITKTGTKTPATFDTTLTYDEKVKGWTSFHTFKPDFMVAMNNDMFSFDQGDLYIHHDISADYNEYYGVTQPSKVSVMVNDSPSEIKELKALSLEGSEPWDLSIRAYKTSKSDFTSSSVFISEFKKKEGLWFAYARRDEDTTHLNSKSTYGIGKVTSVVGNKIYYNGGSDLLTSKDTLLRASDLGVVGTISTDSDNIITLVEASPTYTPSVGEFILGRKPARIEGGNLRGYTLRIDLTIDEAEKVELFAVNSEVIKSAP